MISITITGIERLNKVLVKLKNINNIVYEWMKSGKPDEIMQKSFLQNFRAEGRPKWMPLADETIMQRDYEGYDEGPILQRSGELMDAVTSLDWTAKTNSTSSKMEWGIQQMNSNIQKKFGPNQTGKGKSGQNLPARPMIGFQTSDGKQLVTNLSAWILKSIV